MKIYEDLTKLIGNTPLVNLKKYSQENELYTDLIAKVEYFNPLSSVKDRLAMALIKDGEDRGLINKDTLIVEPTSGNTGIGLAYISSIRGYKLVLTMPESASVERIKTVKALGTQVVLTPAKDGMKGAIEKAKEIAGENPNSYIPSQFDNPANPKMHEETTGVEIFNDTDGKVDIFVAGVGTGGTLTGVSRALKKRNPNIKIVAVEPKDSAVLSGNPAGGHKIQGIGAGFIPGVMDTKAFDEIIQVANEDAFNASRSVAKSDGLLVGISSGAALYAATQVAKREENKGKVIVVLLPDSGERYLSTSLF